MESNDKNLKIKNTKYTLKESPHYEEQKDEIELLNNIIPDRLTIESEDPNYVLNITVQSSIDNPEKEYKLMIYLNYFYPEKSPRFEFSEKNDFLQESRKKEAISRLNKVLEENFGFQTLYQLYECAVEFADEEEERRDKIINQYKMQEEQTRFPLNQMKIYNQFDKILVTDIVILKNNYLVLSCCEDKFNPYLKIIDEKFEEQIQEFNLLDNTQKKDYQFCIKSMIVYNISNTEDELYLICSDKSVRKYIIKYLKYKSKKTGLYISIEFFSKNSFSDIKDLLLLNDYMCFLFLCKDLLVFWKHNEKFEIFQENIINEIPLTNSENEIFTINKNLFALTSARNKEISFLEIENDNLKEFKWGKKIKVNCSKANNYILKINEKNILFTNNGAKELVLIYLPTWEIVAKYEWGFITSVFLIKKSIYICQRNGIEEIDFKKNYIREVESNLKKNFNSITLIKPIIKGYYAFASSSTLMICK